MDAEKVSKIDANRLQPDAFLETILRFVIEMAPKFDREIDEQTWFAAPKIV